MGFFFTPKFGHVQRKIRKNSYLYMWRGTSLMAWGLV